MVIIAAFSKISVVTASVLPPQISVLAGLSDARFHKLLYQCSRQRLIDGEVDGSFGGAKAFEFGFELFDYGSSGEQAAVIGKRGVPHQHSFILESRNSVADDFG